MANFSLGAVFNQTRRRLNTSNRDIGNAWQVLTAAWEELAGVVEQMSADLEQVSKDLKRQARRSEELDAKLEKVLENLAAHDARLNALSQQRTSERLTSGSYIVHHEIGNRYRSLRDQTLVHLAHSVYLSHGIPELSQEDEASILHWLSRAFFSPAFTELGSDGSYHRLQSKGKVNVIRSEFERVWQLASKIREDAAKSGHPVQWDFEYETGRPVDESRQEVYVGCDPAAPVQFAVSPGYVVDGKTVYVSQLVYTAPQAPPKRQQDSYWDKEPGRPREGGRHGQRRPDDPGRGSQLGPPDDQGTGRPGNRETRREDEDGEPTVPGPAVRGSQAPTGNPGEHGPAAHGPGEQGPGAHGPGEHGPGAHGPGAHDPGEHDPGAHDPGAHGPGAHGPGEPAGGQGHEGHSDDPVTGDQHGGPAGPGDLD